MQAGRNVWIAKPGENSNRGNGIALASKLGDIAELLRHNPFPRSGAHTFVLQKYIESPFLIHKRKFDIRCYALVTSYNGLT